MDNKTIIQNILLINQLLVEESYATLIELDRHKKFAKNRIKEIIEDEYGGKVTDLPQDVLKWVEIYERDNSNEVLIQFDLWIDGKKSDLTITCKLYNDKKLHPFSIENLRVL